VSVRFWDLVECFIGFFSVETGKERI